MKTKLLLCAILLGLLGGCVVHTASDGSYAYRVYPLGYYHHDHYWSDKHHRHYHRSHHYSHHYCKDGWCH